jgi:hypothetical protein
MYDLLQVIADRPAALEGFSKHIHHLWRPAVSPESRSRRLHCRCPSSKHIDTVLKKADRITSTPSEGASPSARRKVRGWNTGGKPCRVQILYTT